MRPVIVDVREHIDRLRTDGKGGTTMRSRSTWTRTAPAPDFLADHDHDDKDAGLVGEPDPLVVQRGIEAVGD